MMPNSCSIDEIDDILPQTQCGLCGYAGCRPYATAIVEHAESINKCLPGGIPTLKRLAELRHIILHDDTFIDMQKKTKSPTTVKIRESECIGCTKCLAACPVDAIIGASKQMHTVITDQCTGCELCLPACPVDCIELAPTSQPQNHDASFLRTRYQKHTARLIREAKELSIAAPQSLAVRKTEILEAIQRNKIKKQQRDEQKKM
jgi:electron transport complex protein RnfB